MSRTALSGEERIIETASAGWKFLTQRESAKMSTLTSRPPNTKNHSIAALIAPTEAPSSSLMMITRSTATVHQGSMDSAVN